MDKCNTRSKTKGFVPVDGCFHTVKILQQIIEQQRKHRKVYNIVFLDLAKVFHTIFHNSIKKRCYKERNSNWSSGRCPRNTQEQIHCYYCERKIYRKIAINTRVKQGCPLSPLLFKIVMDGLIEKLRKRKVGIEKGGEIIMVMAFADDLVLITEDASHMTIA